MALTLGVCGCQDTTVPALEAEIEAMRSRLEQLAQDKAAFAKDKKFREAGAAKKEIEATEVVVKEKQAALSAQIASRDSAAEQGCAHAPHTPHPYTADHFCLVLFCAGRRRP